MLSSTSTLDIERAFGAPTLVMHRAELHGVLLQALGSERVQQGAQCVGFEQDTQSVTAIFADGRRVHGDLLIGADGLRSVVRAQLHGEQAPRYAGYTAWRAVVPFDRARVLPGETWGAGARFGQVPLSDNRVYWFATKNTPTGERSLDGEKAELLRRFHGWHAPIEALIEATPANDILHHDIYDRPPLQHWGTGRVTLLGDAAHPMAPNLGQGACQAIEDAVVLMKQVSAGADVAGALRAYEAQRIQRMARIVVQSRRIGTVGQWHNPLGVAVRDMLIKSLGARLQERQLAGVLGNEV